ncbi:MAG: hypothetical protein IT372_28800 [Polyangiaceae bacterium]|nr:hypothetical protein [Polyangiaceae bacterium]
MGYIVGLLGCALMGIGWNARDGWIMFVIGAVMLYKGASMINAKKRQSMGTSPPKPDSGGTRQGDPVRHRKQESHERRGGGTLWLSLEDIFGAASRAKKMAKEEYERKQRERIDKIWRR